MSSRTGLLDGELVRARRLELGISERKLTAMLGTGFSQTVVRGIEAGTNHADLTLGEIARLAGLLDLPVGRLLIADTSTRHPAGSLGTAHGPVTHAEFLDTAVSAAGAVLAEVGRALPEQTIAELIGQHLDQLDEVLTELHHRLTAVGLRLHRVRGAAGIRPADAVLGTDAAKEVWRRNLARVGLNVGQVNVLAKAYRGEAFKSLGNKQRVKAAELANAGILTRTSAGGFALSAATAFSLMT